MTKPRWLTIAEKDVGYAEGPDNDNKFGRALGLNHEPWCDLAVTRWCQLSKHPLPSMQPGMTTGAASVWYSMRFAQAHGLWRPSWEAKPGWQIVYGWQGPSSPPAEMHTGLVVHSGPQGSTGRTVEGNRGDKVGRFTFTVGESVVLGCIDLPRLLLGRDRITVTPPKPDPQPRSPHHPAHTGPAPSKATETETQAVNVLTKYAKAHVATIAAVGAWLTAALADGQITGTEWYGLLIAVAGGGAVAGVKNRTRRRQPKTT